jgi:sulfite reductase alpha subunit-like flavoprotein
MRLIIPMSTHSYDFKFFKPLLTRYSAYSRESGQDKKHVQDLLLEQGETIHDALLNRNGRVYICGKVSMAEEVNNTIIEVIAKEAR